MLAKIAGREVLADMHAGLELDALGGKLGQPPVKDFFVELEIGDAQPQQAAHGRRFSNTTTSCPARASCCAAASAEGPLPTIATRRPLRLASLSGTIQPSSQAALDDPQLDVPDQHRLVVEAQRAGGLAQGRADAPVNSGKLLVECRFSDASRQRPR